MSAKDNTILMSFENSTKADENEMSCSKKRGRGSCAAPAGVRSVACRVLSPARAAARRTSSLAQPERTLKRASCG